MATYAHTNGVGSSSSFQTMFEGSTLYFIFVRQLNFKISAWQ